MQLDQKHKDMHTDICRLALSRDKPTLRHCFNKRWLISECARNIQSLVQLSLLLWWLWEDTYGWLLDAEKLRERSSWGKYNLGEKRPAEACFTFIWIVRPVRRKCYLIMAALILDLRVVLANCSIFLWYKLRLVRPMPNVTALSTILITEKYDHDIQLFFSLIVTILLMISTECSSIMHLLQPYISDEYNYWAIILLIVDLCVVQIINVKVICFSEVGEIFISGFFFSFRKKRQFQATTSHQGVCFLDPCLRSILSNKHLSTI